FEFLAGRFGDKPSQERVLLHWRYPMDPPELLTVMVGETDGHHLGVFWDDPNRRAFWIVGTYARDAIDLIPVGINLPRALRRHLEGLYRDAKDDGDNARLQILDELRKRLSDIASAGLTERVHKSYAQVDRLTGQDYLKTTELAPLRAVSTAAPT